METNLDFAEARMYQNLHGRFTAVDPLLASGKSANPQTFNRYVYVMNNPLRFTDPSGLQAGQTVYTGPVYFRMIVKQEGNHTKNTREFTGKKCADCRRYQGGRVSFKQNGEQFTVTRNSITRGGKPVYKDPQGLTPTQALIRELGGRAPAVRKIINAATVISVGISAIPLLVPVAASVGKVIISAATNPGVGFTFGMGLGALADGGGGGGSSGALPSGLTQRLTDIYQQYPINEGGCQSAAQLTLQAFADYGITGNIVELKNGLNTILAADGKTVISIRGYHQAVQVGDLFYDAMTGPQGVTWEEYQKLFTTNEFRPLTIHPPREYIPPQEDEP